MRIFVSSSSLGLVKYRGIVRDVLGAQGFEVVVQESFDTPGEHILTEIKKKISDCQGVIAMVGPFYGKPSPCEKEGVILSYTQFELEYALHNKMKTHVLFTGQQFEAEPDAKGALPTQSKEEAELQQSFVKKIKRRIEGLGWSSFNSAFDLAMIMAKTKWRQWE